MIFTLSVSSSSLKYSANAFSSASNFSFFGLRRSTVNTAFDGMTLTAFGSNSMVPTVATPPDCYTRFLKKTFTFAAASPASTRSFVGVVPA